MAKNKCKICGSSFVSKSAEICRGCSEVVNYLSDDKDEMLKKWTLGKFIGNTNPFIDVGNFDGYLCLTNKRLFFVKSPFKGSKVAFSVLIDNIQEFEPGKFSFSQFSKTTVVKTKDGTTYKFIISKCDEWKAAVNSVVVTN